MPLLWKNKEDERAVSEVPQGNGIERIMDNILEEKINRFCMLNHPAMEKWIKKYELAQETLLRQREEYRRQHQSGSTNVQYPSHLKELPKHITIGW